MTSPIEQWNALVRAVNNAPPLFGQVGVRDPEYPCELFDGKNYDGTGDCESDGHYLCTECSHLSPLAPRFAEHEAQGRANRLLLFWARHR